MKGYMLAREASCKWCVSESRVHKLCQAGRVPGVSRFGRLWVIPADTEKPCDPRKNNRNESQRELNNSARRMKK